MTKFADVCLSTAQRWEVGKTYLTRSGSRVRILATDLKGDQPICGAYFDSEHCDEEAIQWSADGCFNFTRHAGDSPLDLTTELAP